MKVFVNEKEVSVFAGACANDAVRQFLCQCGEDAGALSAFVIYDSYGHEIGEDSPLHENQSITIEKAK